MRCAHSTVTALVSLALIVENADAEFANFTPGREQLTLEQTDGTDDMPDLIETSDDEGSYDGCHAYDTTVSKADIPSGLFRMHACVNVDTMRQKLPHHDQ